MSESNNGERTGHRFGPGNKFGRGRPAGSRNRATIALQVLLEGQGEAITLKAVEMALSGDTTALRLCIERLIPPVRERRVGLELSEMATAADITAAIATVLQGVGRGDLTPSEGQALAGLLEVQRRAIETANLEDRVEKLERDKNEGEGR